MAFDGSKFGFFPGSAGRGGFLTYYQDADSTANIVGPSYWPAPEDIANQSDANAMQAIIDFIKRQSDNPTARGVIFFIVGSNVGTQRRLYLSTFSGKTVVRCTTSA